MFRQLSSCRVPNLFMHSFKLWLSYRLLKILPESLVEAISIDSLRDFCSLVTGEKAKDP
jgi:hypothetical protein